MSTASAVERRLVMPSRRRRQGRQRTGTESAFTMPSLPEGSREPAAFCLLLLPPRFPGFCVGVGEA
jgi:hypothetical protein